MVDGKELRVRFFRHVPTIVTIFLILGIRSTFANQYVVPTGSMIPTIAIGDHILANRVAYDLKVPFTNIVLQRIADPQRGDVVVFESPKEPGLVLVKRLVAIPGDRVTFENGFVTLNGKRLDDFDGKHLPYHESLGEHRYFVQRLPNQARAERFDVVVPAGHYLMFGDNRDNSADSRYFGFVPREKLIGRASRVLYSFDFPRVHFDRFGKALD
jgi:signal peptidase I